VTINHFPYFTYNSDRTGLVNNYVPRNVRRNRITGDKPTTDTSRSSSSVLTMLSLCILSGNESISLPIIFVYTSFNTTTKVKGVTAILVEGECNLHFNVTD